MNGLNGDFLNLYISIDRFIKDAYKTDEGVSEYIRLMECYDCKGRMCVAAWGTNYDKLKRMRWIRNQIAHEVGVDVDLCEEEDYDWLDSFRNRLYSASDPLALYFKAVEAEEKKRQQAQRSLQEKKRAEEERRRQAQRAQLETRFAKVSNPPPFEQMRCKTFWQRIKSFFTGK